LWFVRFVFVSSFHFVLRILVLVSRIVCLCLFLPWSSPLMLSSYFVLFLHSLFRLPCPASGRRSFVILLRRRLLYATIIVPAYRNSFNCCASGQLRPLPQVASLSHSRRRAGQVSNPTVVLTRIERASTDAAYLGGQPTLMVAAIRSSLPT